MSVSTPLRSAGLLVSFAAAALWLAAGCAAVPASDRPASRETRRAPAELVADLESALAGGRYETADSLARAILAAPPGNANRDEVLYMACRANHSLGAWAETVKFAEEISSAHPLSPRREEAMLLAADAYARLGRHYESAEVLSRLLASPLEGDVEQRAVASLERLAEGSLTATELERLVTAFPASPLAADASFKLSKIEFARGNYERSAALLTELLNRHPEHPRSREAQYLLEASADRRIDPARPPYRVELNTIGVLLPYTGEYSQFGRTFEEGVRLAVEEFNASAESPAQCVLGDSKSDPIAALAAVRKLIVEKGVVAVVGSVFTIPSIVAATECNAWKVPMVSPLVREAGFGEIGAWVFPMQLPVEVELAAMARIAVKDLLLERIAVLAPSTSEGRRLAEFFTAEVERLGGSIAIEEYYGLGDTDFREPIGRIRVKAPDAMFIPAGPDELVNVLPQIRFYDIQVQLLGLSSWNSEKLLRLAGRELEGALFPRSGYYGRDPGVYERFEAAYRRKHGREGEGSGLDEVSPVTAAGYFGTRFVLEAFAAGAVDREQVRERLASELNPSAEVRMKYVESLPMIKVASGTAVEFHRPGRE